MSAQGSIHVLRPPELGGDGDKCMCNVRLSGKLGRRAAAEPSELTCDACILIVVRMTDPMHVATTDLLRAARARWPWDKA